MTVSTLIKSSAKTQIWSLHLRGSYFLNHSPSRRWKQHWEKSKNNTKSNWKDIFCACKRFKNDFLMTYIENFKTQCFYIIIYLSFPYQLRIKRFNWPFAFFRPLYLCKNPLEDISSHSSKNDDTFLIIWVSEVRRQQRLNIAAANVGEMTHILYDCRYKETKYDITIA